MWKYFFLGLLVGWLVEWIIDWFYWRRGSDLDAASPDTASDKARWSSPGRESGAFVGAVAGSGAESAARVALAAEPAGARMPAVPGAADGVRAGKAAADVAVGTHGRLAAGSAAPGSHAPVYRQEDLEAVAGIGPKIGAMLRNNGITTFAELAVTPVEELARIVESTGEEPEGAGVETWAGQAQLAAAQDWEGFARLQDELQSYGAAAAGTSAGTAAGTTGGSPTVAGARRGD